LLPETELARRRAVGGHASCPCIALRERQFLGHFGAGPKEDLVRRLPTERWMRHLRVVLIDVEFDHRTNTRHRIQGIQEQSLMFERTPIGLDERIGEAGLDLGEDAFQARTEQGSIDCTVDVLDAGIGIQQGPARNYEMLASGQQHLARARSVEALRHGPRKDFPRVIVQHRMETDFRSVEQLDERGVDVPDFVWL